LLCSAELRFDLVDEMFHESALSRLVDVRAAELIWWDAVPRAMHSSGDFLYGTVEGGSAQELLDGPRLEKL
jgi:hypothetical protein